MGATCNTFVFAVVAFSTLAIARTAQHTTSANIAVDDHIPLFSCKSTLNNVIRSCKLANEALCCGYLSRPDVQECLCGLGQDHASLILPSLLRKCGMPKTSVSCMNVPEDSGPSPKNPEKALASGVAENGDDSMGSLLERYSNDIVVEESGDDSLGSLLDHYTDDGIDVYSNKFRTDDKDLATKLVGGAILGLSQADSYVKQDAATGSFFSSGNIYDPLSFERGEAQDSNRDSNIAVSVQGFPAVLNMGALAEGDMSTSAGKNPGFVPLSDNANIQGVSTNSLQLSSVVQSFNQLAASDASLFTQTPDDTLQSAFYSTYSRAAAASLDKSLDLSTAAEAEAAESELSTTEAAEIEAAAGQARWQDQQQADSVQPATLTHYEITSQTQTLVEGPCDRQHRKGIKVKCLTLKVESGSAPAASAAESQAQGEQVGPGFVITVVHRHGMSSMNMFFAAALVALFIWVLLVAVVHNLYQQRVHTHDGDLLQHLLSHEDEALRLPRPAVVKNITIQAAADRDN